MKYRHVIWDWNGTLFDDAWLCVEVINEILNTRNMKEITLERYEIDFEFPVENYYKKLGFDFKNESFETLGTEFITNYNRNSHRCQLQPQVENILSEISNRNINQSILSAMKQNSLINLVQKYNLKGFFSEVIGLDNHYAKSKVENGKQWIQRSPFKRSEILFVGDTHHDLEVAEVIGVDCVLIPSGHSSKKRLEGSNVQIIDSLLEVLRFL